MFIKTPASKHSLSTRRPICGFGINDADYMTQKVINGKTISCEIYSTWSRMIARCYSVKLHLRLPTYKGCTVCEEWLTFSNFSKWYESNNVEGYHLDKDIKIKGNKLYGPDTCLFVPQCINKLLLDGAAKRGPYPTGVALNKRNGKFLVQIGVDGKAKYIGYFATTGEASKAYKEAKNAEIKRKCEQYPEFAQYLIKHLYEV